MPSEPGLMFLGLVGVDDGVERSVLCLTCGWGGPAVSPARLRCCLPRCEYLTLKYEVFVAITRPNSGDPRMIGDAFVSFLASGVLEDDSSISFCRALSDLVSG